MPLYFGRVASLIIETRELTTDQAEAFVERQARAFELAKPYLVERWRKQPTASSAGRARPRDASASARPPAQPMSRASLGRCRSGS